MRVVALYKRLRYRSRTRHVLIIVENIPASMDHRVSKQIESLVAHGYRVSVITRRHPRNHLLRSDLGVRLLEYRSPPTISGGAGYLLEYGYSLAMSSILASRERAKGRIDVVQICAPPDIYFLLGFLMKALGSRLVVDQRDLLPELYTSRYGSGHRVMLTILRRIERLSQRIAHHVMCVNDYLREKAISSSGVAPDRITVVRNGPVQRHVAEAAPDVSLKQGFPFMACWVGMMNPQDRLDLLIASIEHLVHVIGRTDCRFVLIGEGDSIQPAMSLVRDLDLERWVTFTGWLSEEDVFRYLATANVGLDSNIQEEVSPVKVMEYMAFGLPVVAFDLLETRTTAKAAAAYAPPGDTVALATTIHSVLSDEAGRRAMSQAGRGRIQSDLAWERQAVHYLRVMDLLVAKADGGGRAKTEPSV